MKNEPAFPCGDNMQTYKGVTTRDWFAGKALVALVSHEDIRCGCEGETAQRCYKMADAMMEARGN
jgi:hypothetical protein